MHRSEIGARVRNRRENGRPGFAGTYAGTYRCGRQQRGGSVTATELRDEEGYYEIEVARDDGSQVDVHLNRDFSVADSSPDGSGESEGAGDDDGAG